jgi:hypothetical protein
MISARVDVELERPLAEVFESLVNFADYPRWNPFVVKVEGADRAVVGAQVTFHVRWPDGGSATSGELVTRVNPPSEQALTADVVWRFTGLLPALGLVRAERVQHLTRLSPTRTRYESEEIFHGLLTRFIPLAKVQAGFEAQARAMGRLQKTKPAPR